MTSAVNAGLNSTLINDGSCDTFIYSWSNISMPVGPYMPEEDGGCWDGLELLPRETDIKMLNITYGDSKENYTASTYNRNYFYWAIVDEVNTEKYGEMFIGFKFWDSHWTRRVILYYKQDYDIDTWNGINSTKFGSEGDVAWINGNTSYKGGISNLMIGTPILNESGNSITWSVKYTSYSASQNFTAYDWAYNSTFIVNHTFHFSYDNYTARLKVDANFSDFNIDPSMQGPNYNQANMTSLWDLNARYYGIEETASQWIIDGEVLVPGPENTKSVSSSANFTCGGYNISTIDFGDEFTINGTEVKNLITNVTAEEDNSPTETNEYIHMTQIFPNLNVSALEKVEMDPEISIYHVKWVDTSSPTTGSPPIPGFMILFIIISMISLIAINVKHRRKEVI